MEDGRMWNIPLPEQEQNLKARCAGLAIVLVSLFVFGVAYADFDGVIDPRTTVTSIDSAKLTIPYYPDMIFLTPGWGSASDDSFHFGGVPRWPETIALYGMVNGIPVYRPITDPQPETWYPIGFGVVTPYVVFFAHLSVEESKPAVRLQPHLAVSPSVVTGRTTVRLQPVGAGRPVVRIHDAAGNLVRSLDFTTAAGGAATATWNRDDEFGRLVPEGVYFCRYATSAAIAVRKVLVVD
jgi:hypothetical protein